MRIKRIKSLVVGALSLASVVGFVGPAMATGYLSGTTYTNTVISNAEWFCGSPCYWTYSDMTSQSYGGHNFWFGYYYTDLTVDSAPMTPVDQSVCFIEEFQPQSNGTWAWVIQTANVSSAGQDAHCAVNNIHGTYDVGGYWQEVSYSEFPGGQVDNNSVLSDQVSFYY